MAIAGRQIGVDGQERISDHRVHAFCAIHQLGHVKIRCDRAENVGVVALHSFFTNEEINYLARRQFRGFVQVRVQSHGDGHARLKPLSKLT
jgi:hypothetical protein